MSRLALSGAGRGSPTSASSPEEVVQRQLDAYNAKDIEAWLATYEPQAEQYELHGPRLARGHAEITRNFPEGKGSMEMLGL